MQFSDSSARVKNPIFCAIDTMDLMRAINLSRQIAPHVGGIKLGLEFFTAHGAKGVREVAGGLPVFLDLKFHDIPNTVAGAIRATRDIPCYMMTVHCSGGMEMLTAAKAAALSLPHKPKVIGVTVLTSMDEAGLNEIGVPGDVKTQVKRHVKLAYEAGLDGCVCSAQELSALRQEVSDQKFLWVTPGIRPAGAALDDQKRVMTPEEAIQHGASHLVIGRPITKAESPAKVAQEISACFV